MFNKTEITILSSPLILEDGVFESTIINLQEAIDLIKLKGVKIENFCGHQTVKLLGLDPAKARKDCSGYELAIILKPKKRLPFGVELTVEEITTIGITVVLIRKIR